MIRGLGSLGDLGSRRFRVEGFWICQGLGFREFRVSGLGIQLRVEGFQVALVAQWCPVVAAWVLGSLIKQPTPKRAPSS